MTEEKEVETPLDKAERGAREAQDDFERDFERVDKMGETPEGEKKNED